MKIQCEQLTKRFKTNTVLNEINFNMDGGQVYCLLGRNGAGKSTLINIMSDLLQPDDGQILFNGETFATNGLAIKKQIGLQSQYDQLIDEFNAVEYLQMIGFIYNMDAADLQQRINFVLAYFFDTGENVFKKIRQYSSGMKKKLTLCASLLHKPQVLILDEPFASLDPVASENLCKLINAYINKDRIIFISSHDLLYVDKVATHVGVLNNAKLAFNGTLQNFKGTDGSINGHLLQYLNISITNKELLSKIV